MLTTTLLAFALAGAALIVARRRRATPFTRHAPAADMTSTPDVLPLLAAADLQTWLADRPDAVVLDVRTPAEFAAGHLRGAMNLDVQGLDFARRVATLTRETPYVVYCRSGARSDRAGRYLLGQGFDSVVNGGGLEALARGGFPSERDGALR